MAYKGIIREEGQDPRVQSREFAKAINAILNGNINSTGTVTLTASSTTTVVTNRLIGKDTIMILVPTTATAATAMTKVRQAFTAQFEITLTHDSTADTDRIFKYVLLG